MKPLSPSYKIEIKGIKLALIEEEFFIYLTSHLMLNMINYKINHLKNVEEKELKENRLIMNELKENILIINKIFNKLYN